MNEKRSNKFTLAITDSDLVRLDLVLQKMEDRQVAPVVLTRSSVSYALFLRGLAGVEESTSFPAHSPPAGKIVRVKAIQLRGAAAKV